MPQYDEDVEIQNGHKLQIDYDGDYYVNLNTIMIGGDPLLQIDRGIKALKDLNMYGFVGMSTDQQKVAGGAALMMGHGFTSSTDPPRISLTDSELINCISYSENFLNGVWTGYDGSKTNITNGYLCPDGSSNTAYKIQNCGQSGGCRGCYQSSSPSLQQNHKYTASIWLKGTYDNQPVMIGLNDSYHTTVYLTTNWKRYFYTVTIPPGGSTSRGLQFNSGITGDTYYVWGAQLEEGPEWDFPNVYRSYAQTENGPNLKFDTLYLFRADGNTPANLDLGNLIVNGQLQLPEGGDDYGIVIDDVNLYRSATGRLKTDGIFEAESGALLRAICIGSALYGMIPYPEETIQLDSGDDLRFCFGTNERMLLTNTGRLELPAQGSSGGLRIGDVSLYRDSEYTLRLQNNLIVEGDAWCSNLAVDNNIGVGGDLDINSRIHLYSSGSILITANADYNTAELTVGKVGSPSASKPRWSFSLRSNNEDFWLYTYNGSTYYNFLKFDYSLQTTELIGQLLLPATGSSGGILIGGDANLYRSAQDVLKTDDSFVCSNISGNDAIFNSVKGTYSGAAVKAGDYITLSWDATNSNITAHNRHMKLNTDSGKDVVVARDLNVLGVAKATGYVNTSPSVSWMNGSRTFNTVYQNTTGKTILVQVAIGVAGVGQPFYTDMYLAIGSTANPTHMVDRSSNSINSVRRQLTAVVPAGWYYKLYRNPNDNNYVWMGDWYEQVL